MELVNYIQQAARIGEGRKTNFNLILLIVQHQNYCHILSFKQMENVFFSECKNHREDCYCAAYCQ